MTHIFMMRKDRGAFESLLQSGEKDEENPRTLNLFEGISAANGVRLTRRMTEKALMMINKNARD